MRACPEPGGERVWGEMGQHLSLVRWLRSFTVMIGGGLRNNRPEQKQDRFS